MRQITYLSLCVLVCLVRWSSADDVNEPIIDIVMAGILGTQSFSFIRPGQEIAE